uniref:Uncharacterized protein n=1 Tax=Physcomitrium patens TaxID=3218 RepID=A0A2K1JR94_PHYPA|nr:hypothetical protein PHYPA_016433 [Physcomitrium patens]
MKLFFKLKYATYCGFSQFILKVENQYFLLHHFYYHKLCNLY